MDKPKSYRIMCGVTKIKLGLILSKYSARAQTIRKGSVGEQKSLHSQIQHLTVLLGRRKQCPEGEILIFTRIECSALPVLPASSRAICKIKQPTAHCTKYLPFAVVSQHPHLQEQAQPFRCAGLSCNIP